MSSDSDLLPLKRTIDAIKQIRITLVPFLRLLDRQKTDSLRDIQNTISQNLDQHQVAEAEAAVALAVGTLRYMAARLNGQSKGKKTNDSLRMELDKMRKTLVLLRGLKSKVKGGDKNVSSAASSGMKQNVKEAKETFGESKVGKVLDVDASSRMIRAKLSENPSPSKQNERQINLQQNTKSNKKRRF